MDQAIRALPVRERRLHCETVRGQRLADDIVQLNLSESATGLLVRQDVLQAQHIAGKLLDIGLRLVDRLEPLMQVSQRARRACRGAMQAFRHAARNLGQTPFHQGEHLGLARGLRLGDVMQAAGQLLLPVREALHPLSEKVHLADHRVHRTGLTARSAQHGDHQDQQDNKCRAAEQKAERQRVVQGQGHIAKLDHVRPNSLSISLSFNSTYVGRPWLHWPEWGVASIWRSSAFISSARIWRPERIEP